MLTGGRKAGVDLVLDGAILKWYDPAGTLSGKGAYTRID
jgi:hypothetical protein